MSFSRSFSSGSVTHLVIWMKRMLCAGSYALSPYSALGSTGV